MICLLKFTRKKRELKRYNVYIVGNTKENTKGKKLILQESGPVIGTSVGFNAIAFMYIGRYNKRCIRRKDEERKPDEKTFAIFQSDLYNKIVLSLH